MSPTFLLKISHHILYVLSAHHVNGSILSIDIGFISVYSLDSGAASNNILNFIDDFCPVLLKKLKTFLFGEGCARFYIKVL